MSENQLYINGKIYTMDPSCPVAEAVSVSGSIIKAAGTIEECTGSPGCDCETIDLQGLTMLPGFIDTHMHPPLMIALEMFMDLYDISSMSELRHRIQEEALKKPGQAWILGLQFDEQNLAEKKMPSRSDLDTACKTRPVLIMKRDAHTIIANTAAINAAGITAATPDPAGGTIDREPGGFPAGPFRETAAQMLLRNMPLPGPGQVIEAGRAAFGKIAACGITSAGIILQTGNEGVYGDLGRFDVPLMNRLMEHIPVNLYTLLVADDPEQVKAAQGTALNSSTGHTENRIGGIKFWADGSFGSCTALMGSPFNDHPDRSGFLIHTRDEMYSRMEMAHRAGLQIAVHSIGDESTRICCGLYDRLFREYPGIQHRHRIEHASLVDENLAHEIARLGLVVSTQPLFIHTEKNWLHRRLGPERARWTYAHRGLLDAGVVVAGASDAPIESLNVMQAIQCCVTRDGFETHQAITAEEAVRMFTINAAFAQFEEDRKGSITPGKRADLVVLSGDPLKSRPEATGEITVKRTICGGQTIYNSMKN